MSSCLKDFQLIECLGKGSFGTVVKCIRKLDNQIYAMKQIKLTKLKEKDKKNALNEIRFLASIEHSNIISYKEAFYDQKTEMLCIIMEFANDGDLSEKVKKKIKRKQQFSQRKIWKVAYQALKGLESLHENSILHRDIKSANIFFHEGDVKLGDLNVAKLLKDEFAVTQTGTPYYASPQIWNEQPYGYKSDVWSIGCVIYEMATLKYPFQAEHLNDLYHKVILGFYERIPNCYSKELQQFIGKCLTVDQNKRYTVKQLLNLQNIRKIGVQLQQSQISSEKTILLDTIDFPRNFKQLNQKLPRSNYQGNSGIIKKVHTTQNLESKQLKLSKKIIIPSIKLLSSQKTIVQNDSNTKRNQSQKCYVKQRPNQKDEILIKQERGKNRVIRVLTRKRQGQAQN